MMKQGISKKVMGYIALALVCVMAGTAIGMTQLGAQAETQTVVLTSPFTEAIARVHDSVVGVNNYQMVSTNGYGYGGFGDLFPFPFSDFGFGNGYGYGNRGRGNNTPSTEEVLYGSGSGVVIEKEYVLTNYHVVEEASSLKVAVAKGDNSDPDLYEAQVAPSDPDTDVAVLYVPGLPLEPVVLGNSDALAIGDWVVNIGNPLGFTGTATAGIVSALDREIENSDRVTTDKYGRNQSVVNKMIQTDAAINSGNSGGGMFNTAGELVGIPTLKYSGSRYSNQASVESIGMCIPINEAKDTIEEALKADVNNLGSRTESQTQQNQDQAQEATGGLTGKPRMGVTVTNLVNTNGALPNGAYVISVDENGPAAQAGMQAGDIIVEVNGTVIATMSEMTSLIGEMHEGDEVRVKVFRPDTVTDAEQGAISTSGNYVDLTLKLAVIDPIAH